MIAEAIDTVWTLGWALLVWIILLGIVGAIVVYAVVIVAWATVRGLVRACRMLRARLRADLPPDAPREPRNTPVPAQPRRTPSWARTDHHRWDQAA